MFWVIGKRLISKQIITWQFRRFTILSDYLNQCNFKDQGRCYLPSSITQLRAWSTRENGNCFEKEVTKSWNEIVEKLVMEGNPKLLIKNYPNDAIANEIVKLFKKCGYKAEFQHEECNTFLIINDGKF